MPLDQSIGPPWFRSLSAGFLRHLARKGRRPNTLLTYGFAFRDFGKWLDSQAIAEAEQLTGAGLERWQDLLASSCAPSTQQCYAAALRGVLKWGASQEPVLCSPSLWFRVSTPRIGHLIPKPIPERDLKMLLAALARLPEPREAKVTASTSKNRARNIRAAFRREDRQHLERLRTRALFLVILSSGARIFEALSLDRGQLQDRTAIVIQKGGHQKLLVISEIAQSAVVDYQAARIDSCRALFVNHVSGNRLTRAQAQDGWEKLCDEVGIAQFSNHGIRHSCATELLRQGVDSLIIAKHLGHRGLASIAGYAEVGLGARYEMLEVLDLRIRRAS